MQSGADGHVLRLKKLGGGGCYKEKEGTMNIDEQLAVMIQGDREVNECL